MPFKLRSNEGCKIILSKVLYFGMFCAIFALVYRVTLFIRWNAVLFYRLRAVVSFLSILLYFILQNLIFTSNNADYSFDVVRDEFAFTISIECEIVDGFSHLHFIE